MTYIQRAVIDKKYTYYYIYDRQVKCSYLCSNSIKHSLTYHLMNCVLIDVELLKQQYAGSSKPFTLCLRGIDISIDELFIQREYNFNITIHTLLLQAKSRKIVYTQPNSSILHYKHEYCANKALLINTVEGKEILQNAISDLEKQQSFMRSDIYGIQQDFLLNMALHS